MELKNVEIKRIGEIKTFWDKEFKVLKWVVVDDSSQYPQTLELQSTQDNADKLLKYNKVGERVDVSYNLKGKEWTSPEGKVSVFNTIEAWKVIKAEPDNHTAKPYNEKPQNVIAEDDDGLDGLPF